MTSGGSGRLVAMSIKAETDGANLDDVAAAHQYRSVQAAAVLRLAVIGLMAIAMDLGVQAHGSERHGWFPQSVLLAGYGAVALCAVVLAFSRPRSALVRTGVQTAMTIGDLIAFSLFHLFSAGGYISLLTMVLLPLLIALEVSERRAGTILTVSAVAFTVLVVRDPIIKPARGWAEVVYICGMFAFVCVTAYLVVYVQRRHVEEIARLSARQQALLADTMTGFDTERRRVAEFLHDGPLQSILAARQDVSDVAKSANDDRLQRASTNLREVARSLRDTTSMLHPAVLDQAGLAEAARKLVSITESRSGIAIRPVVDYPVKTSIDPMVYAVMRELLYNVERHSQATEAEVELRAVDGVCRLDVSDNGVGTTGRRLSDRLSEGHIGIASHRARVEAAGGTLVFIDEPVGTHVRVTIPLPS